MITSFERRQRILKFVQDRSTVRVTDLADLLRVSEATIRKDLTALDKARLLVRVRGGAALREDDQPQPLALTAQAKVNAAAKKRIARWAVDMVGDGDAILLDASTTVLHMVPFLQERRNLTIFTNGLETGRALAQNPANTVVLIGGVIRPGGTAVAGYFGEEFLQDLNINTAFISCSGFSIETGLTAVDMREARLIRQMISRVQQTVALIDSSKFGRASLASFAPVDLITRIVTDSEIEPEYVEQLRQTQTHLTICGETTASSIAALNARQTHYRIGFANLSEDVPFAIDVRHGLEKAAEAAGNIDLIVADNQMSGEVALHVADRLIDKAVDLVIEYQIDEKIGGLIMNKFQQADIPVIAVDIPMVGANFFGVDNYHVGHTAGVALGEWIKSHWQNDIDRLIVLEEPRAGALPAARIRGQLDGLQAVIGQIAGEKVVVLDSENTTEVSEQRMTAALRQWSDDHKIAVVPFNSNATLGVLAAAREAGRETDVIIVGQGGDRRLRQEIRRPQSRLIGSTAFMHEKYGPQLLEIGLKLLRGEAVPPATYTDHIFITAENIDQFFPNDL